MRPAGSDICHAKAHSTIETVGHELIDTVVIRNEFG